MSRACNSAFVLRVCPLRTPKYCKSDGLWTTDLLQIAHHVILVAPEYAAEEFYNLLVIEVVDAFHNTRQEQFHSQVKIAVELIWDGRQRRKFTEM